MSSTQPVRDPRVDLAALALLVGQAIATAILYPRLPEQLPIHFDIEGRVDGWAPRLVGAVLLPLSSLVIWAMVRWAPRMMRGAARERAEQSPMALVALVTVALLAGLHFVILDVALSGRVAAGNGLALVLALFTLAIGLVLPRLRRNGIAGIRTPWSLASDENWQRTHRVGGALFFGAGVVGVLATITTSAAIPVTIVALVAASVVSVIYSYRLSRSMPR